MSKDEALLAKPMDRNVNEILRLVFRKAGPQATEDKLVEKLSVYAAHKPLQYVLSWNFGDPKVFVTMLHPGVPKYTPRAKDSEETTLWQHLDAFPYWLMLPHTKNMSQDRREAMFVEVLESISEDEAELLIAAKDGKLGSIYRGLTASVVKRVWPNLKVV